MPVVQYMCTREYNGLYFVLRREKGVETGACGVLVHVFS